MRVSNAPPDFRVLPADWGLGHKAGLTRKGYSFSSKRGGKSRGPCSPLALLGDGQPALPSSPRRCSAPASLQALRNLGAPQPGSGPAPAAPGLCGVMPVNHLP